MRTKQFRGTGSTVQTAALAAGAFLIGQQLLTFGAISPNETQRPGANAGGARSMVTLNLFEGMNLNGWDGNMKFWSAKDGTITGQTTRENPLKANTFLVWTNGTVADFDLQCSFKIIPNNDKGFANSGIQYRSKVLDPENFVVGGYQADMEAGKTYTGILYEEKFRQIMANRGEKVVWGADCEKKVTGSLGKSEDLQAAIRPGEWNDYRIVAQGNHIQHFINGKQMVDVIDDCESKRAMSGVLALQLHAGDPMTVQFKDLQLKVLPPVKDTASTTPASAADELKKFEGTWRAIRAEENGSALAPEDSTNIMVVVKGNSYDVIINDEKQDHGTFSVDPSKSMKQMDIKPEAGPDAGNSLTAIYEIDGDTMRICYGRQGAPRPKTFDTSEDSRLFMLSYKREKK